MMRTALSGLPSRSSPTVDFGSLPLMVAALTGSYSPLCWVLCSNNDAKLSDQLLRMWNWRDSLKWTRKSTIFLCRTLCHLYSRLSEFLLRDMSWESLQNKGRFFLNSWYGNIIEISSLWKFYILVFSVRIQSIKLNGAKTRNC